MAMNDGAAWDVIFERIGLTTVKYSTDESLEKLRTQHSHRAPDEQAQRLLQDIRFRFLQLAVFIDDQLPPSRERSLVQTALDEARMWACNAATANGEIRERLTINIPSRVGE